MNLRNLAAAALLALALRPAAAIELETVDTREQRGAMGFVDMQRVFRAYPETIRAKENFEELVRQAEEQINLRKADILHLRNEFSQLKIERDFIAKSAPTVSTTTPAGSVPQPSTGTFVPYNIPAATTQTAPAKAPAQALTPAIASTSTVAFQIPPTPAAPPKSFEGTARPLISSLPGLAPAVSTAPAHAAAPAAPLPTPGQPMTFSQTQSLINSMPHISTAPVAINISTVDAAAYLQQLPKKAEPLVINIPGVSTAPITVLPPSSVAAAPKSTAAAAAVQTSTTSAQTNSGAVQTAAVIVTNPALAELDAKIALKFRELSQKEADFKEFQAVQEKSLLDLEGRKTEILMGKIYKAIQEVAHLEGVSVVEDKSNILFGHNAVDLTDKVIKFLSGSEK